MIIVYNECDKEKKGIYFDGEEIVEGLHIKCYRWLYEYFSFGYARNIALKHTTREWCAWIDSDDVLITNDRAEFEKLSEIPHGIVGLICGCYGYTAPYLDTSGQFYMTPQLRIWRNVKNVKWEAIIHEQLLPSVEKEFYQTKAVPVFFQHNGYDTDAHVMYAKCKRNVELLSRQIITSNDNREYYEAALASTITELHKLKHKLERQ